MELPGDRRGIKCPAYVILCLNSAWLLQRVRAKPSGFTLAMTIRKGRVMTKTFQFIFLQPGDKVLISHRRLFERDKTRYFVGTVLGFNETNGLLKVEGYSITLPIGTSTFHKKASPNTKIISLTSGNFIAYQLHGEMDVETATIKFQEGGLVLLEDREGNYLDLTE